MRSPTEIPPVSEKVGERSLERSWSIVSMPETPPGLRLQLSHPIQA